MLRLSRYFRINVIVVSTVVLTSCVFVTAGDRPLTCFIPAAEWQAEMISLFEYLDDLGRAPVVDSQYVTMEYMAAYSNTTRTECGWLISETESEIVVLCDDLIPIIIERIDDATSRGTPTRPGVQSVDPADLEIACQKLIAGDPARGVVGFTRVPASDRSEPLALVLMAHAAWKQGLEEYCEPLMSLAVAKCGGFTNLREDVFEDLAWRHLIRGVRLLEHTNRSDVLTHLELVSRIDPDSKYAAQAEELAQHLRQLVDEPGGDSGDLDAHEITDEERAIRLVADLVDARCPQEAYPGRINPFSFIYRDSAPSRLREIGFPAVPALIDALEDQTPTRTVFQVRPWRRDFVVWRVCDFALAILSEIADREFGHALLHEHPSDGFALSRLSPESRDAVIQEVNEWWEEQQLRPQ